MVLKIQAQSPLHSTFKTNLGNMRSCLKKKILIIIIIIIDIFENLFQLKKYDVG